MATLLCNKAVLDFSGGEQCPTELKLREPLASRVQSPCYAVIRDSEVFVSPIPCENRIYVYDLDTGSLEKSLDLPPATRGATSPNLILKHGRVYVYRALETNLYEIRNYHFVKVACTSHEIMSLQITEDRNVFRFLYSNKRGQIFSFRSAQEKCSIEHEVKIEGSKSNYLVGYRKGDLILWTSQNELLIVYKDKTQFRQKILMALSVRNFLVKDILYMWHGNKIGVFDLRKRKFCKIRLDSPFCLVKRTESTKCTSL